MKLTRRALAQGVVGFAATPAFGIERAGAQSKIEDVRIGFQKSSTLLAILKSRGTLENGLQPLGLKVKWSEFTSGLPLLEALNVGAIDVSADVADTCLLYTSDAADE